LVGVGVVVWRYASFNIMPVVSLENAYLRHAPFGEFLGIKNRGNGKLFAVLSL